MTTTTPGDGIARIQHGPKPAITLYADRIESRGRSYPLTGVTAEVPAAGGMTGTRFLAIAGPGFSWVQRSDALFEGNARKFAARSPRLSRPRKPAHAYGAWPGQPR